MLAGGFQQQSRKGGPESCIGQSSRGRRNQQNDKNLVKFSEKNGKFIASSSFQHPESTLQPGCKKELTW